LKEGALCGELGFGRECGPVVRQKTEWMKSAVSQHTRFWNVTFFNDPRHLSFDSEQTSSCYRLPALNDTVGWPFSDAEF
jgi:hypothetical protein